MTSEAGLQIGLESAPATFGMRAQEYARASKAAYTIDAHAAAWEDFGRYGFACGSAPLPAGVAQLVNYL